MTRVLLFAGVLAACAPSGDYTPPIAVEPGAAARLCWVAVEAQTRDAGAWAPDVDRACAELRSDLKPYPKVIRSD